MHNIENLPSVICWMRTGLYLASTCDITGAIMNVTIVLYLVGDECHLQDGDLQGVGEVPLQTRLPQRGEQSQGEHD